LIEDFDDLFVATNYLFRLCVEFNLLDWHSVMVVKCVDRNGVAHIIKKHFTFLCTDCDLKCLGWLKTNACNFLSRNSCQRFKVVDLFLLVEIPELDSSVNAANSNNSKLGTVVDAVQFRTCRFERTL